MLVLPVSSGVSLLLLPVLSLRRQVDWCMGRLPALSTSSDGLKGRNIRLFFFFFFSWVKLNTRCNVLLVLMGLRDLVDNDCSDSVTNKCLFT